MPDHKLLQICIFTNFCVHRKYNEVELKYIHFQQSQSRQHSTMCQTVSVSNRSYALSRATPSLRRASGSVSVAVPEIPVTCLSPLVDATGSEFVIGSGRFGSCIQILYKDMFVVCAKCFPETTSFDIIKDEAAIMTVLNSCEYTPHCFGVCKEKRAIIMSYINLTDKPISLHAVLVKPSDELFPTPQVAIDILIQVSNGLNFVHNKGFLHNDLKLDNIVLGNSVSKPLKAYIIDFGKACLSDHGKKYHLSAKEIQTYKEEHSHIAPDLRDGHISQCPATDVFSLGRILKKVNRTVIHFHVVTELARQCLAYYSHDRPSIGDVTTKLNEVILH